MTHYLKSCAGLIKSTSYVQAFTLQHFLDNSSSITTTKNNAIKYFQRPHKSENEKHDDAKPKAFRPHGLIVLSFTSTKPFLLKTVLTIILHSQRSTFVLLS